MDRDDALLYGQRVINVIRPYCERLEYAGSIRRLKNDVHDIDLVVIPKHTATVNLFGDVVTSINPLTKNRTMYQELGTLKIFGGKRILIAMGPIDCEIYMVTPPAQWGNIFLIRTGPAEFGHWMVTQKSKGGALPDDVTAWQGALWRENKVIGAATEEEYFRICGMRYMQPEERKPLWTYMP